MSATFRHNVHIEYKRLEKLESGGNVDDISDDISVIVLITLKIVHHRQLVSHEICGVQYGLTV